ncbi:uncharacterized protein [Rutidosis leptorrhynchoides]|uniref:uncharacterized protein n=1 Tax=Rutidosis leptorrhynchoides TaxID=125765 RepID=UPI003A98F570
MINIKGCARVHKTSNQPLRSNCTECKQNNFVTAPIPNQSGSKQHSGPIQSQEVNDYGQKLGLKWKRKTSAHKIWGSVDCEFIQKEMIGKSGGQLLMWDNTQFAAESVIRGDYVIGIKGKWVMSGLACNIVNVYGPHDDNGKQKLWSDLSRLIVSDIDVAWVICGDFNEVRNKAERFNCDFIEYRAKRFNEFITDNCLIEIPMSGRIFTRVIQSAWDTEVPVINKKDCMFRNRLKNVKNAIKEWSINKVDNLEGEIEVHRSVAQNLELKAEHSVLDESELESWRNSRKLWFEKEKIKSSILKQKARIKWVLEGDENSKFFHSMVRM